jgi:cytochrome c biogenesis factor
MSEIGGIALRFALILAAGGFAAGITAGLQRNASWTRVAERATIVVSLFVGLAMLALFYAFATFDFQLSYVAAHSARRARCCCGCSCCAPTPRPASW